MLAQRKLSRDYCDYNNLKLYFTLFYRLAVSRWFKWKSILLYISRADFHQPRKANCSNKDYYFIFTLLKCAQSVLGGGT
jgi:hypothetical protein